MSNVDCVINVCGKPVQTALAITSLMEHSGQHIDRIFFIEENTAESGHDFGSHEFILSRYHERIVRYVPPRWFYVGAIARRHWKDDTARLSLRYQFGFEQSDKDLLFTTHNDCHYTGDIIGLLNEHIGHDMAAGHIGMCWTCPAHRAGKCDSFRYWNYRPNFGELKALYEQAASNLAAPLSDFSSDLRSRPWPLPVCRVNEWSALINLRKARRVTVPNGPAAPFGAYDKQRGFITDVGVAWFRDISNMGFRCRHVPIYSHVQHGRGHAAMTDANLYRLREEEARQVLHDTYGIAYPPA